MGRFKEATIDEMNNYHTKLVVAHLVVRYPFIAYHIQQAFDLGDQNQVYELLLSLDADGEV